MSVLVETVEKTFGTQRALKGVSLLARAAKSSAYSVPTARANQR